MLCGMTATTTGVPALEIARQVRGGKASATQVVREHLDRIAALDGKLGAFQVVRADCALAEAAALDARGDLGALPLAGVPVAIKDNFDVAGEPTRFGSAASSAAPAQRDDELVRRLRAAGCIVIGKTRLPELAIRGFTSSVFGVTRNPWDTEFDPGGSTAAARCASRRPTAGSSGSSRALESCRCPAVWTNPGTG